MEMNGDEFFKTGRTATDKTATGRTATGKTAMGKTTKGKLKGQPRNNNKFFSFVELLLPPRHLQHLRLPHPGQPTSLLFVSLAPRQRIQQKD
jgi:hypothetical protein